MLNSLYINDRDASKLENTSGGSSLAGDRNTKKVQFKDFN